MLDRQVVLEFLQEKLSEIELEIPSEINIHQLNEVFCRYIENDYFHWIDDNYKTFFNQDKPDWEWIKNIIASENKSKQS